MTDNHITQAAERIRTQQSAVIETRRIVQFLAAGMFFAVIAATFFGLVLNDKINEIKSDTEALIRTAAQLNDK